MSATTPLQRMTLLLAIPPRRILAAVLAGCATLGAAFALAAVSAWLVTTAWTMPPVLDLSVAVVAVRALGISRGVFRWIDRMLTHDAALGGVVELRTNLFTALAARPGDALVRIRRGDLLARLGDDAQEMAEHVIRALVPSLVAAVMTVVVVATIAPISVLAGAAMLVALLLAAVLAPLASYRAARLTEQAVITTRGEVTAGALGILDDATSLRIDGRLTDELAAQAQRQRAHDDALDRAALPAALASACVPLVTILALLGSLLAAGTLWLEGSASAGQIGVLLLLPLSAFEAVSVLPDAASQLARSRAAAARLDDAVGGPQALDVVAGAPTRQESVRAWSRSVLVGTSAEGPAPAEPAARPVEAPASVHLRAEGLQVGWSSSAVRVRDLDLDLPPGSRLAVVGPSGVGKSTLLATLAGLLEPLDGRLLTDGAPTASIPTARLRHAVTMYAEDAHVFATTVLENLRVARGDLTAEEAQEMLGRVGLCPWVATLPDGLDTVLGPDGTTISGGERRRLLLARSLVHASAVMLLDEPTEHLDTATGDALLRTLLDRADETLVTSSTTVVVVTHRPQALAPGTRVLRLHPDGRAELEETR